MNQIKIEDFNIIHGIPDVLPPEARCAIDTEFTNMDKKRLHRPTGEFACATFYAGGSNVWIVEDVRDLPQAFQNIEKAGWIFHNAKFDIFHLRRYIAIPSRMKMWDTMLVEQVMYSGLYDEFNLASCVRRHLDRFVPKEERETFSEHVGEMTRSQVEYACADVIDTYDMFQWQRSVIDADDLKVWKEVELPFLWCLLSIGGVKLDVPAWTKLASDNEKKSIDIQARYGSKSPKIGVKGQELKTFLFTGINLSSPKQVKNKLKEDGFNLDSTDEKSLEPISDKSEFARDLLEYRSASKHSSTYGQEFIDKYVESDGRVYGDIFQIGAETGRTSSRSPNTQNLPHASEYRACFIAPDDCELVIADWSSQEPRIAAFLSQDAKLISVFNEGKDLYIDVAKNIFNENIVKGDPRRSQMKSLVLGIFYGMSAKGLAERIGSDEESAQDMINKFFESYPGVYDYVQRQRKCGDYVTSIIGRKIWLNKYTNQWKRACLNYPIQSSAADAMKIAATKFLQNWGHPVIKLLVHDEIVLEVKKDDVESVKSVLENAMVSVAEQLHTGIRGAVELYSGHSWAEKH